MEAVISDGNGGWYIGGSFTYVNGIARNKLAHIKPDGTLDDLFNLDPDDTVHAFALDAAENTLYIGGRFQTIGGVAIQRLAAVNTLTGAVKTDFSPTTIGNTVRALVVVSDSIYMGGNEFVGLQKLDKHTAVQLHNFQADYSVHVLLLDGTILYVGGAFTAIDGKARDSFAAIDTDTETVTGFKPKHLL